MCGVLQDHCGRVIFAYYKEFGELEVLEAEAQSLLVGLRMCAEREVRSLTVAYCPALSLGMKVTLNMTVAYCPNEDEKLLVSAIRVCAYVFR